MMLRWAAAAVFLAGLAFYAFADDPSYMHAQGHDEYRSWTSRKMPQGCCSNQDCSPLKPEQWRETNSGIEVEIEGQWCPVTPEHFVITRGAKSPDGEMAHACINRRAYMIPPCARLLCYMGNTKG